MKNIKSIELTNFQSHRDTTIEFAGAGYLTVITGPSDSGKSAVIRALRWLFYNMPLGTDFITVGQDKCSVKVLFEDGLTVERVRSHGGINRYVIDGQTYEGFGTGVPIEAQQATGIRKLQIGDQAFLLNMSEQLDGPFLGKSIPGSARAKVLGKLAGTEEIDFASKGISTDLYRSKRQQEGIQHNIESLKDEINKFEFLDSLEISIKAAEKKLTETKSFQAKLEKLKILNSKHSELGKLANQAGRTYLSLALIPDGIKYVELAENTLYAIQHIYELQAKHILFSTYHKGQKDIVAKIEVQTEKLIPLHDGTQEIYSKYLVLSKKHNILNGLSDHLNKLQQLLKAVKSINCADDLMKSAINGLNKFLLFNPLCNQLEDMNLVKTSLEATIKVSQKIDEGQKLISLTVRENPKLKKLKEIQLTINRIESIKKEIDTDLSKAVKAIEYLEKEYLNYMSSLGKCPTCGGEINIKRLQEVI